MTNVALGPFRLDLGNDLLLRGTEPVALGKRAILVLRALIERPGTLVSKEALIEAAWLGQAVEESNLTVQIAALRRAFGTASGGDGWIETMPRRGYRFVGPVVATEAASLALPEKPSLVVLPFQNMTGDAEQEYFVDGMVEEITTAIARLPWLFVIARNSAFTYKRKPFDVKQVAQELGVRYVLEGSVRKAANRVRITGQLIDTATGAHIWADRFDGALNDIFDLQDQVASNVAGAIEPKLRQSEIERASRKPASSLSAYDLYLRALAQSYRYTVKGLAEAVAFSARRFKQAAEWADRALHDQPRLASAMRLKVAALAYLGDLDEARAQLGRLLAIDPKVSIAGYRAYAGHFLAPEILELQVTGMRLAGMPEN
jgi:TolB-like protein